MALLLRLVHNYTLAAVLFTVWDETIIARFLASNYCTLFFHLQHIILGKWMAANIEPLSEKVDRRWKDSSPVGTPRPCPLNHYPFVLSADFFPCGLYQKNFLGV